MKTEGKPKKIASLKYALTSFCFNNSVKSMVSREILKARNQSVTKTENFIILLTSGI
jgi:hypothetical protein